MCVVCTPARQLNEALSDLTCLQDAAFIHHILCRLLDEQQILVIMRRQPHYVQYP
jgi:hypothetical protein